MLKNAPKPNAEQKARIQKLEEEAQRRLQLREESWERSDTDGFLSQWAHQMTAQRNLKEVELLRNGGHARFAVLCDAEGNVVADRIYEFTNQFSHGVDRKWRLPDDLADKLGRKWVPVGSNSRIQKQLGLHQEDRWFPARAAIMGSGTGLSGCASAYVGVERILNPRR